MPSRTCCHRFDRMQQGRRSSYLLWACLFFVSVASLSAQGLSPLEESNRIFGQGPKAAARSVVARPGPVAVVDYRLCLLLHPLMARLRYSAMAHVLPSFEKLDGQSVDMPSASQRKTWRQERQKLLDEQARLQQWISNLGLRLNQEIKAKGSSREAEERFYAKKRELETKLGAIHTRLVALERKQKNPLEQATALREKTLATIRGEVSKVVRFLAKKRNFDLVFNSVSLPMVDRTERKGMLGRVETSWGSDFSVESNPYDLFFGNRMPAEGGKGPNGTALLEQWIEMAPPIVGRMARIEESTVLFGGYDLTWDVLELLLRKYKVARSKIDVLQKFVFDVRAR